MRSFALLFAACAGCQGGLHRKGDRQLGFLAVYGTPITRNRSSSEGADITYAQFLHDRLAFTATVGYRRYNGSPGANVGEGALGFRYYYGEVGRLAFTFDVQGGFLEADDSVPARGTHYEFIAQGGPGAEWRINDRLSLLGGLHFRHISNAHGGSVANPTQNDFVVQFGFALNW